MSSPPDPLRRLAAERGRILGELGVRANDNRWARLEAETIAGMVTPALPLRLPAPVARLLRRLRRLIR